MSRKRKEAIREATIDEIKASARKLMGEHGTAGLSIRAIAREMDLTPAALYHYFGSLDDIITALILDAFNALADAMEQSAEVEGSAAERLMSALIAYRRWALDHPADFQLIYGNPLPGYHAPREVTVPAVVRGFSVLVALIEEMFQKGEAVPKAPYDHIPPRVEQGIREMIENDGYPVSALSLYLGIVGWTQLHGIIMLELFNHLQPVLHDVDAYYQGQLRSLFINMGLKDPPG